MGLNDPPLLDSSTWEMVQALRMENQKLRRENRRLIWAVVALIIGGTLTWIEGLLQ